MRFGQRVGGIWLCIALGDGGWSIFEARYTAEIPGQRNRETAL